MSVKGEKIIMDENFENVKNTVEAVETPIEKPIEMRFQEAKSNIYNATNQAIQQYGLPFYVVESIVSDILHQVQVGVKNELDAAKEAYDFQRNAAFNADASSEENIEFVKAETASFEE